MEPLDRTALDRLFLGGRTPNHYLDRPVAEADTEDRVEEIRQSVTDEAVKERVERIGHDEETATDGEEA